MKVIHCPVEIAGQMGILSRGLQEHGITPVAYNTFHSYLDYRDGLRNIAEDELETMLNDALAEYDLFHFHYARTFRRDYSDLERIRALGKPVLMHHWGNDVRTEAAARRLNPYAYAGDSPPPDVVHARLAVLSRYIDHALVQDYEVYPYVSEYYKQVHVVPIAYDVRAVTPQFPDLESSEPLVVHAPTNPLFKGTAFLEAAIDRLRREGFRFRYVRIEKTSNRRAVELYREADLVIDQILCGSYGMLAVETMSLGKPVVGFVRDDLASTFPAPPPIISCNPDTLYDRMKELLLHPEKRLEAGQKGRRYVENYHDVRSVAGQLAELYRRVAADRSGSGR